MISEKGKAETQVVRAMLNKLNHGIARTDLKENFSDFRNGTYAP